MTDLIKFGVEFVGSLVFFGVIALGAPAWLIGATLAILVMVSSKHSWAHFNPAVTIMASLKGDFPAQYVFSQMGIQFVAAALIALVMKNISKQKK